MRQRPPQVRLSLVAFAAAMFLVSCQRQQATAPAPAPASEPKPPPAALPPSTLGRGDLLQALDAAASDYAAGRAATAEDIAGRRFSLRQAFGCGGPTPDAAPGLGRWTWSRDKRAIELSFAPADWASAPAFIDTSEVWEAVEGFWIARPWMRDAGCPAPQTPTAPDQQTEAESASGPQPEMPEPAERQVAGLAAVFARGGSRVGRRDGKPFVFSLRGEGDSPPDAAVGGYRLVLEGRFVAFPEGRAIRCTARSPDIRPACVAAAEVDRVAFEDADGKLLREWRPG